MDGATVAALINRRPISISAARMRYNGRRDLVQSLVIMKPWLLLIILIGYMIPALSDRETRCQLLYEKSEVDRQGRSRTRNSNSGHRDADSPAYSDARPS